MSPRLHLAAGITLALTSAALATGGLLGPYLQRSQKCTDISIELDGLDQITQAAFKVIAADWANASDHYARDYDAHTAEQGPAPFQIPGAPVRSKCDYSTVAQECSGILDRELHPDSSPAGEGAEPVSTKLQLSLSQPDGVMLLSASTGACATMKGGNWSAHPNLTLTRCLYQPTEPLLPQPQYWLLSNRSIASVVGPTQPGYQWKAAATIGSNVSGALPSGMPTQEEWLVLPLPAPVNVCTSPEQAAPSSCRPTPYPVMIIRQPAAPDQGTLCAASLRDGRSTGTVDTAGAENRSVPEVDFAKAPAVAMRKCHPTYASQIWQVMTISGEPLDLTAGTLGCPGRGIRAPQEATPPFAAGG